MCDTVVVVRDDVVLFAKNSDRDPNEAQRLDWVKAHQHAAGSEVMCTWRAIPQVRHTHALMLSRPYWMWGAEMGTNEHGVVIGNEAVFTNAGRASDGLLGMDLVRLGLERGASAEEALSTIEQLVRKFGQGGRAGYDDPAFTYDNSFLIADATGAWVLETAGHETERQRVEPGVRAISNGLTLQQLATRRADRLRGGVAQCKTRRARMERRVSDAQRPSDMARGLRDHGAQPDPIYSPINGAMGAPCMHAGGLIANSQTVGSWISELTVSGAHHWATGTAAPCLSAFKPIGIGYPLRLGEPTGVRDGTSAWWRFEEVHRRIIGNADAARAWCVERDAFEQSMWDLDGRRSDESWRAWSDLVAKQAATLRPALDERPWHARRYWRARDMDASRPTSKLPAR